MATVYTFLFGYDIFILLTSENWGFIMTDWGHMIPRSIGPPCRLIVGKNFLWSGSKWYLQKAHQFLERHQTECLHKKIWFKTKTLMNHRYQRSWFIKKSYLVATGSPFFTKMTVDIDFPKWLTKTPNMSP